VGRVVGEARLGVDATGAQALAQLQGVEVGDDGLRLIDDNDSGRSISDLLLFELDEAPGVPLDDVVEVSSYVAALDHGLTRLAAGFPLSNRLIREIHGVLLSRGRGAGKDPGRFRRSQSWLGGTRPGNAAFVPPPHTQAISLWIA